MALRLHFLSDPPPLPPKWVVPNIFPEGLSTLAGPPGWGKTALLLGLSIAVATGGRWLDIQVHKGAVLWIAAEARRSTLRRLYALTNSNLDLPVVVADGDVNLTSEQATNDLIQTIDAATTRLEQKITLVVIDSLTSSTRGCDENSAKDMSRAMGTLLKVCNARNVSVILLAHVGKSGIDTKVRGHSGILADVDAHIAITGRKSPESLLVVKQRDGESGITLPFRIMTEDDAIRVEAWVPAGRDRPRPNLLLVRAPMETAPSANNAPASSAAPVWPIHAAVCVCVFAEAGVDMGETARVRNHGLYFSKEPHLIFRLYFPTRLPLATAQALRPRRAKHDRGGADYLACKHMKWKNGIDRALKTAYPACGGERTRKKKKPSKQTHKSEK